MTDPAKRLIRGSREFLHPFFSHDLRTLYTSSKGNLIAIPIAPDRTLGEPKVLFPWRSPDRFSGHMGAASREGNRLLLIDTSEKEKLTQQVLTDWTTLLPK